MFKPKFIILSLFSAPFVFAGNKLKESPGQMLSALLFITLALILISIGLIAIQVIYSVLKPQVVREGSNYSREKPLKLFLLGVALAVLFLVITFILEKLPAGDIKGIIAIIVLIFYAFVILRGLTMLTHNIGDKILSSINSKYAGSSFMSVLAGASITSLISFVPFVGWFIIALILLTSLGLGFIGLKLSHQEKSYQS